MIRPVPSCFTGAQREYLAEVRDYLNAMPVFSFFSGLTPESSITGVAGNFAIAPYAQSAASMVFVKWGSPTVASKVSWTQISLTTVA